MISMHKFQNEGKKKKTYTVENLGRIRSYREEKNKKGTLKSEH